MADEVKRYTFVVDHLHRLLRGESARGEYVLHADYARIVAQLEARLAALDWRPITPESLPKVGDEVLELRKIDGQVRRLYKAEAAWTEGMMYRDDHPYLEYHRPLNAPQEPAKETK